MSICPWPGICCNAAISCIGSAIIAAWPCINPGNMEAVPGGNPPSAVARAAFDADGDVDCVDDEDGFEGDEGRVGSNLVCNSFGKNF